MLLVCKRRLFILRSVMLTGILALLLMSKASTAFAAQAPGGPPKARQVLVINSYHQGFHWTDDVTAAVMETLSSKLSKVEFHVEYMDSKRFFTDAAMELFYRTVQLKYAEHPIEIVITSDDNALQFVRQYHDELFADVPVIFCGVNQVADALSA